MSNGPTKDEVVKMAREAGFSQDWQFAVPPATLSNFTTLCRAPLVAEVERLKKMSVANIMVRIVPGYDGGGEEIYAKSVEEVNAVMSDLSQRLDDVETDRDDWKARAEAAEAELAWANKDAERYQWLRKSHHDDASAIGVTREHMNGWGRVVGKSLRNSDLDKAIDEAIAKDQS